MSGQFREQQDIDKAGGVRATPGARADAGAVDDQGRSARGQSEEVRRPPASNKVVQAVRDRLSFGALDWAVTDKEALGALGDLADMPRSQRRQVMEALHKDGLLGRLFDNLPAAAFKARSTEVLELYAEAPVTFLTPRLESLLDTGILDSVTRQEAEEVIHLLSALPQAARDDFTYKDGGKWYRRLMGALPTPPGQTKAEATGDGSSPQTPSPASGLPDTEKDKPGIVERTKAGYRTGKALLKDGRVDLNDVEAVLGGEVGGMQLDAGGLDDNQLDLELDWEQGFLDAQIATLNISAMHTGERETIVTTGPGTLRGVHAQIRWSTEDDPESELRFELEELTLRDIQILMHDITIVVGMIGLRGLEVFAKKPPERTAPPTSKVGAIGMVGEQVKQVIGVSLPGLASLGTADPRDPGGLVQRIRDNFGSDLEFALSLDSAQIKDVRTSDGDEMSEMEIDALDVSVRQESRIQELEMELKALEMTLQEGGGDLGAITPEDHQRIAWIKAEVERLRPLDKERRKLAQGYRAGTLDVRQRDRLRQLDNELNQGVARIELDRMAAQGIVAKGHTVTEGEIEGLSARISGGSLTHQQDTDRGQLAKRLGLPPPEGARTVTPARAELSVDRVSTQGVGSDDMSLGAAEATGLSATVQDMERPGALQAAVRADMVSATELQTADGAVSEAHVKGLEAGLDQRSQVAQASAGSVSATGLQLGGTSVDSVSASDVGAQVDQLGDADQRAAKVSVGQAQATGISTEAGALESATMSGLKGTTGPGMNSAEADIGSVTLAGAQGEGNLVKSASLEGIHLKGDHLQDANQRTASAHVDRGEVEDLRVGGAHVAHGSVQDLDVSAGAGLKTADASLGRADVSGVTRGDLSVDAASVTDLKASGSSLDDKDSRALTASMASGSVQGLRSKDMSLDSAGLSDVRATSGAGGDSASLQVGTGQVSKLQTDKTQVNAAQIQGLSASATDLKDADRRTIHAGVQGVQGEGVRWGDGHDEVSADVLQAEGLEASVGPDSVDAKAKAIDGQGASWSKSEDHGADAGSVSIRDARVAVRDDSATVDAGKVSAQDVKYRSPDAKASVGGVALEGSSYEQSGDEMQLSVDQVDVQEVRAQTLDGEQTASLGSGSISQLDVSSDGRTLHAGTAGAHVDNLNVEDGDKAGLSVGSANVGASQVALGGAQGESGTTLLAARTEGLQADDVKAHATPGLYAKDKGGQGAATGARASESGTTTPGHAGAGGAKDERMAVEPLSGMSGKVQAILPIQEPISTTVTLDIPVQNGIVKLSEIEVDVTGLLAEIAIGDHPLEVTDDGGLLLDITGPWNVMLLEPGQGQGLITEEQGGGKQGSVALKDLVDGLMNAKVEKRGTAAQDDKKKKKKKKKKKDKPPIELGRTEIHVGDLSLGDGRVGTDSAGVTLDGDGTPGANTLNADGTLGDSIGVRADSLRTKDVNAGGAHMERVDVDGLKIDVDKPLEDQRSVKVELDKVGVGETTLGDQDALRKADPNRPRS